MALTNAEISYLNTQQLGRLATVQPDGSPQVKPVGFGYNAELGTIDVTGFNLTWVVGAGLLLMGAGFSIVGVQRRQRREH